MDIAKILLPVDGSEHSVRAAREAAEWAKHFKADIILLHCSVVFPNLKLKGDYAREAAESANKALGAARDVLQDHGIRYMERVIDGSPTDVISDLAEREKVDMIVMAPRGVNPLQGLLLGSVTERVLKTAPCRVLIVR
ncbi:universal stress protein [Desulfovibrio mangrovi]|uniref:universal stress protein n=1 Tax=Desulfovibrio mangrovi TaxID=2976983 RepID=UPI002245CDF8|nr:universal stress protein [Desulfovibrio mangrovi]UZP66726.1 universal stress protein [Desulfovibrio mangrovi]